MNLRWIQYKMVGLLALPLLFSFSANAFDLGGQLKQFSIFATSAQFKMTASGQNGSIGALVPILASKNISLELIRLKSGAQTKYFCDSFTFDLFDSFATCDLNGNNKSITFDFANSQINSFSIP